MVQHNSSAPPQEFRLKTGTDSVCEIVLFFEHQTMHKSNYQAIVSVMQSLRYPTGMIRKMIVKILPYRVL
jgi:hypothetical protein